jgi:acetyl-CoA synthetase
VKLNEYLTYNDAQRNFSSDKLWDLFDGTREDFNLAHECIDRHAVDPQRVAIRIVHPDGNDEILTFREISDASSQFANWLAAKGFVAGERVAIMLEPSLSFYAAIFGAIKFGAIAVPMFTLFGADGVRLRVEDCQPRLIVTNVEKLETTQGLNGVEVCLDVQMMAEIDALSQTYTPHSKANDLAVYQYTSGTTRALPEAVKHSHRAVVVLMSAALYGTGIRPGDRFFCPSSPAWGHGLWHGTIAPLAMGVETGVCAGKFSPERLLEALERYGITNLSAASTHYRMMKNSGIAADFNYSICKSSFTGEPIDSDTLSYTEALFGVPVCSMYGTTEVGVILVNYPGAEDFVVKPGSLGKPVPGLEVAVQAPDGSNCATEEIGEIMVRRRDAWISTRDRGWTDADGYFYHAGRADDVIISAGWTIGPVEVEDSLLKHPDIKEVAVIGAPDELRGQIVKAFVVSDRAGNDEFLSEIQDFVRTRLSQHEYPRQIAFVSELPKTPAGKVNRKTLREQEAETVAKSKSR